MEKKRERGDGVAVQLCYIPRCLRKWYVRDLWAIMAISVGYRRTLWFRRGCQISIFVQTASDKVWQVTALWWFRRFTGVLGRPVFVINAFDDRCLANAESHASEFS
jgi:hypothetical protein